MEEQSIADYNQAVSAKADIGRDSSKMYRFSGKMEYRRHQERIKDSFKWESGQNHDRTVSYIASQLW